jgi:hypothetical protein
MMHYGLNHQDSETRINIQPINLGSMTSKSHGLEYVQQPSEEVGDSFRRHDIDEKMILKAEESYRIDD